LQTLQNKLPCEVCQVYQLDVSPPSVKNCRMLYVVLFFKIA
jgi:hypothetical protein